MKVIVIDNEENIRKSIIHMLLENENDVFQIFEAEGVRDGVKMITTINPDVVLLDVELDDGTGMDLLLALPENNFHLIFITAHDKYAIHAFKFSAIDFLLKPISDEDLVDAFKKVKLSQRNKFLSDQLKVMYENINRINLKDKKIVLKDRNSIYFINVLDIIRCESDGQYTEFYIENDKRLVISKPLKEYEELLKPYGFIRPHHSHIVNINKISRFDRVNGGSLIMITNDEIPVSHRKKTQILEFLNKQ